jgi:hypothetical protein
VQITGHKTRSIFDRYSIVGGQEVQDAAAKLEKRFKSSLGTILGTVDGKGAKEDEDGQDDGGGKPLKERGLLAEGLVAGVGFEPTTFGL